MPEIKKKILEFDNRDILNLILMAKNPKIKKFSLKKNLIEISFFVLDNMKNGKMNFEDKKIFFDICENIEEFVFRKNQKEFFNKRIKWFY